MYVKSDDVCGGDNVMKVFFYFYYVFIYWVVLYGNIQQCYDWYLYRKTKTDCSALTFVVFSEQGLRKQPHGCHPQCIVSTAT